ncbi:conserved Plasmodium protein, unknown function [Plasmodium yoelii]|uniref:Uncharacterized protein n=1 Tax=Plasmodium yoelii TaxID=5861 RepID=A0A077YAA2_PLAYE|nr:conserved Plasmodium protein, unknown function [Plasmodium yoelii]CDU19677.1 conserved Plasmodium protein, unknown function [Plasmodium yoelii]VTZ80434.1 conserved Plasmodium protein, unknown function [Plasmodium yoelii]|eukprot:XP_022813482.1 conserved Plasmodium protein, unknown function [Plasmodium yoelii]
MGDKKHIEKKEKKKKKKKKNELDTGFVNTSNLDIDEESKCIERNTYRDISNNKTLNNIDSIHADSIISDTKDLITNSSTSNLTNVAINDEDEESNTLCYCTDSYDNFLSTNKYKLTNIKTSEIFENNFLVNKNDKYSVDNQEPCDMKERENYELKGFNNSTKILEDIEKFKKKKKEMDKNMFNIENKTDTKETINLNNDNLKSPTNIEEKETVSYKLKKKKKIDKYNISVEEKDKHMKKYMLRLEEQYKKKKEEDLKNEINEKKEEIKNLQEKDSRFINYLKNPRLNLSKNDDLNDYLCIYPLTIYFTDVMVDSTQTEDLVITNKSNTLLHIIIVPPSMKCFFIKDIINMYNKSEESSKNTLNHQIAPGHSIKIKLGYNVLTLNHLRDNIKILSEAGSQEIQIKVFQSPPKLEFPKTINFGPIRSNEKKNKSFTIKNKGNDVNILIIPKNLFEFYEKKKNIEKEENILNLLTNKKNDNESIIEIKENNESYYMYNNIKSRSYNFLFLYKKLVSNFDNLYFENVLQDIYYFNLKSSEEKSVIFFFKSGKIGAYEKKYYIIPDIDSDFSELKDREKYNFINYNGWNIFQFRIKVIVEPILLNLVRINKRIARDLYECRFSKYLENQQKDKLDYFFYSNSGNSYKFSDIQVNSGYNFTELEVVNNGLIDLNISCYIYVNENPESKKIVLEKKNKGTYYYEEFFDPAFADSLYENRSKMRYNMESGKIKVDKKDKNSEKKKKKKNKKKCLCPIYIYPQNFVLSYKKPKKIYIVFKPKDKHKNYKNYHFVMIIKNICKGSDVNIENLLEIDKKQEEKEINGFPLVCVRENKIIDNKKWNELFGNNFSRYEYSSSSLCKSYSSYSEINEEMIKKKQKKNQKIFNKKNKTTNFIGMYINIYANIIEPSINIKSEKLSKCFMLNPLFLYKTSFTIKNQNDFYISYLFENVIKLSDSSRCNIKVCSNEIVKDLQKDPQNALLEYKEEEKIVSSSEKMENKQRDEDSYKNDEDAQRLSSVSGFIENGICYYDYYAVLNEIKLINEKKKNIKYIKKNVIRKKTNKDNSNTTNRNETSNDKPFDCKQNLVFNDGDEIANKKCVKSDMNNKKEDTITLGEKEDLYYNLNKKFIKYFYNKGNNDNVQVYVLIKNVVSPKQIDIMNKLEVEKKLRYKERRKIREQNLYRDEKIKDRNENHLKTKNEGYYLLPHEKRKIVLYFLVNKYGYHKININMSFYMGNYNIKKEIKCSILTKSKGISINQTDFVFENSYSHYGFCNIVKINNLDKDLKLIRLEDLYKNKSISNTDDKSNKDNDISNNNKYGFITLYTFYCNVFNSVKKVNKNELIKKSDLIYNFKNSFYKIIDEKMDKNGIKKENDFYNCNKCKCLFKYNSCIDYLSDIFSDFSKEFNIFYNYLNGEKYIIHNMEKYKSINLEDNDEKISLNTNEFNKNFKQIYKHHEYKYIYIHDDKINFKDNLIVYPSNLLLLPLRETFFVFFFFFSHANSISFPLRVKWDSFCKEIFMKGTSKNHNIKITYDKKYQDKNNYMKNEIIKEKDTKENEENDKERKDNYIGICSDIFYVNFENLNELNIGYELSETETGNFEYNYYKKKYILINNCNPKLNYYYKNFDSFIKVNKLENKLKNKLSKYYLIKGEENNKDKTKAVTTEAETVEGEHNVLNTNKENALDAIHACIITEDDILNKIGGKKTKRHGFRLLVFHNNNITKDENFIKLKFSINFKYFNYCKIIKLRSHFFVHTFDFILINEKDLLLSLFDYMKNTICVSKGELLGDVNNNSEIDRFNGCQEIEKTKGNKESSKGRKIDSSVDGLNICKADKTNEKESNIKNGEREQIDVFVNKLIDDLSLIKIKEHDKSKAKIKRYMEEINNFFNLNIDENMFDKFENYIDEIRHDFDSNIESCIETNESLRNEEEEKNIDKNEGCYEIFNDPDRNSSKLIMGKIDKFIWVHKLLNRLNNKLDYDLVDFVKKRNNELFYNYDQEDDISRSEENDIVIKNTKERNKNKPGTHLLKNYCYNLNNENDVIYIIINNKNKVDLNLNVNCSGSINDNLKNIFNRCINNLIMKKEWQGLADFLKESNLEKNKYKKKCNVENIIYGNYNKLKHLNNKYKMKNEEHYYNFLNNILNEKSEYCLMLKNNLFLDFVLFKDTVCSMKSAFIKIYLYSDNINMYRDKIFINLSKSEQICNMSIKSEIKSLHLLNPYKVAKNGDKCIFINSIYIDKGILKNYKVLEKNERNENICKCFEEILKPYEVILLNSSNFRKNIICTFSDISDVLLNISDNKNIYISEHDDLKNDENKKIDTFLKGTPKSNEQCSNSLNELFFRNKNDIEIAKNSLCSTSDGKTANSENDIKIDCSNICIDKKAKKYIKICLENILHKEGNHVYKFDCNYKYIDDIDTKSKINTESSLKALSEHLIKSLYLTFYLYVNIEKPKMELLWGNKISHDKTIKFDFKYFNKKAYKKINKMYTDQLINDILYEDINEINGYFDETFSQKKSLNIYFINMKDINFYSYIYTKLFFEIKKIYIDSEEFDHTNTRIYHIKRKSKICIKLEIDEVKFKKEIKNKINSKKGKKHVYEDYLIFQYLTSEEHEKFIIECNYIVPFLIMKENKYIFHEFNNLRKENQIIENCKELNDVINNISDKVKENRITYNDIEIKDNTYYIYIKFSELKLYKFCLFLFNTTQIPITWTIKEEEDYIEQNYHLSKNSLNGIFHFSKTKNALFGKTYGACNTDYEKEEKRTNPFLFPNYIIVTFAPIMEKDITKKYFIDIGNGYKIYFYLKGIYVPKNGD